MPFILSINVGLPTQALISGKIGFRSAIFKKPVTGRTFLGYAGFDGDAVADPVHHGGPDKAVCVYPMSHYSFWKKNIALEISPGAFGENLTVDGLIEIEICIGDIFRIGEAEVQCSQPRQPCHKLNKIFNDPEMGKRIHETGFSGWYMRVIKQGWVEPGAEMEIVQKDPAGLSVSEANQLMYHDKRNFNRISDFLTLETLSSDWRELFNKRLAKYSPELKGLNEV